MPIVSYDPIAVGAARQLPVRATLPEAAHFPLPLVILSHGNFLSRGDYRPLVEYWARAGFLVLQPDHIDHAIDGFHPTAPQPPDSWRARIADVTMILNSLDTIERRIGRPIDRKRIVVAGHSFGALAAEALVGARVTNPSTGAFEQFADARVAAVILLAPPGGGDGLVSEWRAKAPYLAVDFATMRGPVLVIAGANDSGPMSTLGPVWRTDAYRRAAPGTACLVVVAGAGHYLGGINGPFQPPIDADPARLALVRGATTAFLLSVFHRSDPSWPDFRKTMRPGVDAVAETRCN